MGYVCRAPGLCGLQKMPTEGKSVFLLSPGQATSLLTPFPLDCLLRFMALDFGTWMTTPAE